MMWTTLTNALSDEHEQMLPIRQATANTKRVSAGFRT
jgi:hypothetical protein